MIIRRKQWFMIVIGTLLWTCFLHRFGSEHHTFTQKWQDNISNISSAFLFRHEGLDIYKKPTGELVDLSSPNSSGLFPDYLEKNLLFHYSKTDLPIFIVWENTPRPYPLGAWLWYGPSSFMVYGAKKSISQATLLLSMMLFFIAHLAFILFFNLFLEDKKMSKDKFTKTLEIFVLFFCYYEFIRWSGQGQYDLLAMVPLMFSIKSYRQKNTPLSLFFFGVALFFHFRSLFALGLIVFIIVDSMINLQKLKSMINPKSIIQLVSAFTLALVAGLTFYWNLKYVSDPNIFTNNNYHYSKLIHFSVPKLAYYLLATWGVASFFLYRKRWDLMSFFLGINLILLTTPLMRGWYVMFVFPLFLLVPRDSGSYKSELIAATLGYIFLASTYIGQSPFEFTFIRELISLVE